MSLSSNSAPARAAPSREHIAELLNTTRRPLEAAAAADALYAGALVGQTVRLSRACDFARPCCENLGTICPGKGPHAYELRCYGCFRHKGWFGRHQSAVMWAERMLG
jgi:hypothetical protein